MTVTLSDAPAGVTGKAEEVVANMQGALTSSETAGVRTITSFQPPHTSQPLGSSGSVAGPQADLSKVLPSDEAKVYGGELWACQLSGRPDVAALQQDCAWNNELLCLAVTQASIKPAATFSSCSSCGI